MLSRFVVIILMISSDLVIETSGYREVKSNGVDTVLAMEGEPQVVVNCNKDIPLAYCGFLHPNGTRFSFSGVELNDGRCSITLANATKQDSGVWKCYVGKKTVGAELVTSVYVRVADRLAAVTPITAAVLDDRVTLLCTTTKAMIPLSYCRFEPPSGDAFSINTDTTAEHKIMDRYFYPQNKSLDRGDCAVTIEKVKYDDVGNWTCGVGLKDDGKEYTDILRVEVEGLDKISAGATTGITFAVLAIIVAVGAAGYVFWKRHNANNLQRSVREGIVHYDISPQDPQSGNIPLVVVQSPSEPSASSPQLSA